MKKIIYCFWTGDEEISDDRKKSLNSMIEKSGNSTV